MRKTHIKWKIEKFIDGKAANFFSQNSERFLMLWFDSAFFHEWEKWEFIYFIRNIYDRYSLLSIASHFFTLQHCWNSHIPNKGKLSREGEHFPSFTPTQRRCESFPSENQWFSLLENNQIPLSSSLRHCAQKERSRKNIFFHRFPFPTHITHRAHTKSLYVVPLLPPFRT